jgi:selenocysteine-specific elongation factor
MAHKIIGTAGHIDHGKSSLIKALTGTDPDRLSEEQERGMTIDLGFAFMDKEIAFIDVPGHERFIKNMVAGASTIDAALLVIAADDGVMPQTREHLDILNLLQIKNGVIALTKIDMVEEDWLDIVEDDIRDALKNSFLKESKILRVSSNTGEGIPSLRDALVNLLAQTPSRQDRGIFWMPVDRSFSIKGHGTVVTGSILSGKIRIGDTIELFPAQQQLRIRGIQTHGESAKTAGIGERTALNVMNIAKDQIERGNVVATAGYFQPSNLFDAKLYVLPNAPRALTNRTRVRLHLGTREVMARLRLLGFDKIEPGNEAFVQLLTEEITVAQKRDPFVIRQYSPQLTIGGGVILDANPKAHRRSDKDILKILKGLENFDPVEIVTSVILQQKMQPIKVNDLCKQTGLETDHVARILDELLSKHIIIQVGAKSAYVHFQIYETVSNKILNIVEEFHKKNALKAGISRANLLSQSGIKAPQLFERILLDHKENDTLVEINSVVKYKNHQIKFDSEDNKAAQIILKLLQESNFTTPPLKIIAEHTGIREEKVQRILGALLGLEKIIRFEGDIYFHMTAIETAKRKLIKFALKKEEITVSDFREMLNTSRKFAMPLLGYFDELGITMRVGDVRQILIKD